MTPAARILDVLGRHEALTRHQIMQLGGIGKRYLVHSVALDMLVRRGLVQAEDAGWCNGLKHGDKHIVYRRASNGPSSHSNVRSDPGRSQASRR